MNSMRPSQQQQDIIDSFVAGGTSRWMSVWAGYVIALLVGSVLASKGSVDTGLFVIGLPLAWLSGWLLGKRPQIGAPLVALTFVAGIVVGYFA